MRVRSHKIETQTASRRCQQRLSPTLRSVTVAGLLAGLLTAGMITESSAQRTTARKPGKGIRIAFQPADQQHPTGSVSLTGLRPQVLQELKSQPKTTSEWQRLFAVSVFQADRKDLPPMLGNYRVIANTLQFTPRFQWQPGLRYRAVFKPRQLKSTTQTNPIVQDFQAPTAKPTPAAQITQVYPTSNQLPENQLKFYIHFSSPMSRGESYRNIRLLDSRGAAVEHPFLELPEELWDYSGTRFTLFFDPGRIKRGLKPRELFGPALLENQQYTLVIQRSWRDARGQALQTEFRKRFRVTAPDDTQPNPSRWKLNLPQAGSLHPLTVVFAEPLDHAMLERVLSVHTNSGRNISGEIGIAKNEPQWSLTPQTAWKPGVYELVIDTTLEDRAGNSIARPFEVDRLRRVGRTIRTRTVARSFVIPPN